jgi:CheY-like chemotaxis protein
VLILVVDDDSGIRRMLSLTLRSGGYDVTTASDGREALDEMSARPPDAVVLDLQMPIMDGETFLREVRLQGIETPVIVVSGKPGGKSTPGANAFFRKPFAPDDMLDTVARLIAAA